MTPTPRQRAGDAVDQAGMVGDQAVGSAVTYRARAARLRALIEQLRAEGHDTDTITELEARRGVVLAAAAAWEAFGVAYTQAWKVSARRRRRSRWRWGRSPAPTAARASQSVSAARQVRDELLAGGWHGSKR